MDQSEKRASGCSITLFLIFGMIFVVFAWHWIPELIRKNTTSFRPAQYFPVTGTFASSQFRHDPLEARNSKLTLDLVKLGNIAEQLLLMTYQSDVDVQPIKLLLAVEEWHQVLMRERDESYNFNATLRAETFESGAGESLQFHPDCRLVGKNYSLGPALGRRFGTNRACSNSTSPVVMDGYFYRKGDVLCVDLSIETKDSTYRIEHRPQLMQCLKKQKNN